jgi:hypothetical protein
MAHKLNNTFTTFKLTEEEQASGQTLTTNNLMVLQNLMASAAEEKLALKFDPTNPMEFAQREAELMGQIGILRLLVELAASSSPTISM